MDTYASDVAALADTLDLQNAVHIGHSAGGGEAARYVARAKPGRVAKAVLIGAVTPIMIRSPKNTSGLPTEVFDGFRTALVANRAQFYRDIPAGPFFGFNRPGAKISEGLIQNWWRQAMMGGIKAQYDCIKALSETDFTEDLKAISKPTLILHGDDDQIVPIADSSLLSAKLVRDASLKVYPGLPHGMCTTHPDTINPDLLAFIKGYSARASDDGRCGAPEHALGRVPYGVLQKLALSLDEAKPDGLLLAGRYRLLDHERALERLMPAAAAKTSTSSSAVPIAQASWLAGLTSNIRRRHRKSSPRSSASRCSRTVIRCRSKRPRCSSPSPIQLRLP